MSQEYGRRQDYYARVRELTLKLMPHVVMSSGAPLYKTVLNPATKTYEPVPLDATDAATYAFVDKLCVERAERLAKLYLEHFEGTPEPEKQIQHAIDVLQSSGDTLEYRVKEAQRLLGEDFPKL